jgi:hypothetical protein
MPDETNGKVGGFSTGELQLASWWVRNGLVVRRAGYGSLIALCVLLWGYIAWGLLDAYAISYPRESRITRQIALNQQLLSNLEADRPQNITSADAAVFSSSNGKYDFSSELNNPNDQWWAEFTYRFSVSGEETPLRSGYVLPASRQILTEVGYKPSSPGSRAATLIVENIRWHRMDPVLTNSDFASFKASRFNIEISNAKFTNDLIIGKQRVGQSTFTVYNRSGYGFWSVDLVVRLYRGGSVASLGLIKIERLKPGESREVQIVWSDAPTGVSKTEVIPQVNLLDPSVYMKTEYF